MTRKFYKADAESKFYKAHIKARTDQMKFKKVHEDMCEIMGLEVLNEYGIRTENFWYDVSKITDIKTRSLFKSSGFLKKTSKLSKGYIAKYQELIKENDLDSFRTPMYVRFVYGLLRTHDSQSLRLLHGDDTMYVESNYVIKGSGDYDYLQEISEKEFIEARLRIVSDNE